LACVALVSPKEYPEMEGGRPQTRHAWLRELKQNEKSPSPGDVKNATLVVGLNMKMAG
jgi:hypothetical protein